MRAGGVNVLDIFAVVLIADRPEALGHHCFGKAGDRRQRGADFMADFGDEFHRGGRQWWLPLGIRRSTLFGAAVANCRFGIYPCFARGLGQDERHC